MSEYAYTAEYLSHGDLYITTWVITDIYTCTILKFMHYGLYRNIWLYINCAENRR
jgi:hypothetical protein